MKKILALALCALMMVAMIASVSATDYIFAYDFEDEVEGDWIAVDGSLKVTPKQFSIQVAKFDGTMCMKYDRQNYQSGSDADCFSDMMNGGTESVWGLGPVFVFSYDVYFEKLESTDGSVPQWQVAMLRMTPAAGTQFQQSFTVFGNQICAYQDPEQPLMEIETGKWYNLAVVFDMDNKCFSLYVDGVLVSDSLDWNCADTSSTEAERMRIAWNGNGDHSYNATAYVDNFKVYNAEVPENATGAKLETSAPETAAPETSAAETTAAATAAVTTDNTASTGTATATADVAVVLAAVSAIAASGAIVLKKKR